MRVLRKCASRMLCAMYVGAWMLAASVSAAQPLSAQGSVALRGVAYTPAPGGAERRAILNAVRTRVRTKAVFEVSHLLAADGWAFFRCGEVVTVEGEAEMRVASPGGRAAVGATSSPAKRSASYLPCPNDEERMR